MSNRVRTVLLGWVLIALAIVPQLVVAQAREQVYTVAVDQGLTRPAAAIVRRALREAEAANATALIIRLQGGGSLSAAWPVARELAEAQVPVVVYVAPRGVQGGPVGTLLSAASHVAAMAPDATIGFAQPLVDLPAEFSASTQQLLVDDAVEQLTGWARERDRNEAWLEQAARSGAIIDADRAQSLEPPVIEIVASTEEELLASLQGRRVVLANGNERTLQTLGARVQAVEPGILETLAQALALPTVALVLFVVGGIALSLELATPGVGIPGVLGGILVLAAIGGFVLGEVRPLAVLLLALGLIAVGLEYVVMSHGGLTLAGVILFVAGALYLVDPARSPGLQVSYVVIGGVAIGIASAAAGLIVIALRVRRQRPTTGQEALVGQVAEVRRAIAPEGLVFVNGALWQAWTDQETISAGEFVEILGVEGLRLFVRRLPDAS